MLMRKVMRGSILALFVLSSGVYAMASGTATLTLVNETPGNLGAGGAFYVYPYNFSINNSPTLTPLMCDDYSDEIYNNESWPVTVNSMADIMTGKGQMTASSYFINDANLTVPAYADSQLSNTQRAYADAAWLVLELGPRLRGSTSCVRQRSSMGIVHKRYIRRFRSQAAIEGLLEDAQNATKSLTAATVASTLQQCCGVHASMQPDGYQ